MKLLLTALAVSIPCFANSIEGETSTATNPEDAKILFYQMSPTVRVAITNEWCKDESLRKTHPWTAYQFYIEQGKVDLSEIEASVSGCFGPLDINDISFVWDGAKPFTLPANAFLLPQDLYHQEVPKVPQIKDDGTRQNI